MKSTSILMLGVSCVLFACSGGGETGSSGDTSSSSSGGAAQMQTLTVNWTVAKPDGSASVCPSGYPKIKVVASAADGSGARNGDDRSLLLDCTANTATMKLQTSGDEPNELNPDGSIKRYGAQAITGKYTITLVISDDSGALEYQAMVTQDVDLLDGDKTLTFVVTPEAAPLSTAWGFIGESSQQSLPSCAAAGVAQVRVKSMRVLLPDMSPDPALLEVTKTYPCDFEYEADLANADCTGCQGVARSEPLLFGHYATSIDALAGDGSVVATLPYDMLDVVRVDHESLVFSSVTGGGVSRAYVGLASRDYFKLMIPNK